jgi:transcriptional regulator with XRE-family HTH domain
VCLSRQELAELVNAWVWDHHEKMVEHSANWIGQLERGKVRWPGKVSREALRAILGVSIDAALGFVNARRAILHHDRGRALAKMRRVNETLTAIGTAEDHFAHSPRPTTHRS